MRSLGYLRRFRHLLPFATLVVLVLLVGAITPVFLTVNVLLTLMTDTATLFILAAGITFVIMLGGIDLSGQSIASLASVVLAISIVQLGLAAVPLAIFTGMAFGFVNGLIHVFLKLPSFIATLAMGSVATSGALLLSGQRSVPIPTDLRNDLLQWIIGESYGLPNQILVGIAVLLLGLFIERLTVFGHWSRAVGSGEPVVRATGVPVGRVKVLALVVSGGLAGLAGVVIGARLASGSPTIANEFLLPAIAAVIVGGTAITGGVGTVVYTLIGALIISVVRIGMTFIGVDIFAQQIVFGILIVLAAAATIDRTKLQIVK